MSSLELKVPPLLLVGAVAAAMALLARWLPALDFTLTARPFAVATLAAAGAALAVLGGGVYRASRNPMYLGMALLLAAWGLQLANLAALLGLPLFVLYMNRFQIGPEERGLRQKFGSDFDQYRAAVRRWL